LGLYFAIISIIFCILFSYIIGPHINYIGNKFNIIDIPNLRKVHKKPIVRIGGLSIFITFYLYLLSTNLFIKYSYFDGDIIKKFYVFLIGACLFFLIGIHDDIFKSPPLIRLFFQFSVALFVSFNGINFSSIYFPIPFFGQINLTLIPVVNYLFSAFWIVGITNAINWIDGMDALAGGYCAILSCGLFVLMFVQGNEIGMIFYSIFLGSIIGFLIRNFNPAFYIMGDCGSNFLGFSLASSVLLFFSGSEYGYANISYIFLLFSLPICDMILVISERLINNKNIFLPDKNHIHHKLMNLKLDYKYIIFLLFSYSSFTTIIATFYLQKNNF